MKRRGFTILEVLVSAAILAAMTTVCVELLGLLGAQQRAIAQRHTAIREAGNIMERLAAAPFGDITRPLLDGVKLSSEAAAALPAAELKIELESTDDPPAAKRIAISIRWKDRSGQWTAPVSLVSWKYEGRGTRD
jgi:prepilin-type N-terminal cleavage/methylation domain-containing protein